MSTSEENDSKLSMDKFCSELEQKAKIADVTEIEQKEKNIDVTELSIDDINLRIRNEICNDTINELTDNKLISEYRKSISVKGEIKKLEDILIKYVESDISQKIIGEYLLHLIPPGTKGVIRGNKFNNIVKQYIKNLNLDNDLFEICFEKKSEIYNTSEIPDWYILEKKTNKIIIGMNQLDLWKGGHQLNRGSKYIEHAKNNEHCKLLCVVCNHIQLKNKNKIYKIFKLGFKNNTLCYLNNLGNIINSYFSLNS